MIRIIILLLASSVIFQNISASQTRLLFVGDKIQKYIYTNTHFISENSDTLILNNKILHHGTDYVFNQKFKRFELLFFNYSSIDSLFVQYRVLPSWLQQRYGKELPAINQQSKSSTLVIPTDSQIRKRSESDMTLSGSKSFRFSSSKSGNAGFNQTLDLNLSGHLAKNLTLEGTISDRGYNPSYGTSNSRLNELDKINLQLRSPNFSAQIGDILVGNSSGEQVRKKKVSGLDVSMHNKNIQVGLIAARPKGQFNSVTFLGTNNKQGPYQIKSGGARQAIIPGSETVWLDGIELKRGTNNDYTFDYPNGQITFNVNHIIDSRTRVLIDYEPLSSEYKQEYLHTHTGFHVADSLLSFEFNWIREGDDKDENLTQSFSLDDQQLLSHSNDENMIVKTGLLSDTLGDYELNADSLPDTIYHFVGENLGQYDVHFSFVDSGNGEYRYVGGSEYLYVGSNNGDYLPVIILNAPKRIEYLSSKILLDDDIAGEFEAEWNQSKINRNLFSDKNKTIDKNYYNVRYEKSFDTSQHNISASFSLKEYGYAERNRVNDADYKFQFYLPSYTIFNSDEQLTTVSGKLKLHRTLTLVPMYNLLKYQNQFDSKNKSIGVLFTPMNKITISSNLRSLKTSLNKNTVVRNGRSDNNKLQLAYKVFDNYRITSSFENRKRTNNYNDTLTGFAHDEYVIKLADKHSELSYQYYTEDTLSNVWGKQKDRKRVQFKSENKFRQLDYKLQIHYQETDNQKQKNSSLLTRGNFIYSNRKQNLQIQSSYMISNETRFSRGIRYLEVNNGEGDYIFADSQFVPEVGGDYILVEELLSESADVKRGEKSFSLSKKWEKVFFRFNSNINEELFAGESRSNSWLLPMYSDSKLAYLFFNRFIKSSLKLFPLKSGYFFTFNFSEQNEMRFINNSNRVKESMNAEFVFNQIINQFYIEEKIEYFNDERDAYYFRAGDIDGYAASGKLKYLSGKLENAVEFKYRTSESVNKNKSQLYILLLENRFKLKKQSELRINTEFYKSNNNNLSLSESYLLTNNRPGNNGAVWSVIFRAKIKKEFRLNLSVQGRHSDIHKARIFARTEFVAQF